MGALTARNLKVFFRDHTAVVMSFFSDFIMIGLYALFLRDQVTQGLDFPQADNVVNAWIISGIIAVTSMTATLSGLGTMVEDRVSGIERDFLVSPLRRSSLTGAYAVSSFTIGAVLTLSTFVLGEIFIAATGGEVLDAGHMLLAIAGVLLSVASSGAIVFFIASLLRSNSAYSMVSLVVGVLIGFLTGAYIPVGVLSEEMQWIVKLFPAAYSASYFRFILTEEPIRAAMEGAPASVAQDLRAELGVVYDFDGTHTTMATAVLVMIITAGVFFVLTWINFSIKKKSVA
ncbi:MAG: ABC transporter permease [Clostridia bacterium]|nr:ABC transporter permease [Clostridia bacterium]